MKNTRKIGDVYEKKAVEIIRSKGYTIVATNYRGKYGEIDIICKKGRELVFVEVKYRKNAGYGYGIEAVDKNKMKRIYMTAMEFLEEENIDGIDTKKESFEIRFDCISFLQDRESWIKNLVWGDEIGF